MSRFRRTPSALTATSTSLESSKLNEKRKEKYVYFSKRQGIFRVQKLLVASFELGSWRVVIKFTAMSLSLAEK